MQSAKETAANIGASAKSGMEKTKAIVQEKAEKMTAHDPVEKDMATQKKEERKAQAELNKMEAREHNAATKEATSGPGGMTHSYSTTGTPGYTTGPHQMSAVPGHGAGRPTGGHVTEGTTGAHPIGLDTGAAGRNPRAGSGATGTGTTGAGGAYRPI